MFFLVNEIFESLQGEGSFTGTSSVFVRFQGCTVGCPWCDTKYSWEITPTFERKITDILMKEDENSSFARMSENEIVATVSCFSSKHVVLTGGEPCLYDLTLLTEKLLAVDKTVQIETSGTEFIHCARDVFVTCSPKVNMPGGKILLTEALKRADELKCVVGKTEDITFATSLRPLLKEEVKIWLQPLSKSTKAFLLCEKAAKEHGFRVSLQIHKYIGIK